MTKRKEGGIRGDNGGRWSGGNIGGNQGGAMLGGHTQASAMTGTMRCLVCNTEDGWVGDRTTVPNEGGIMGGGDHGTVVDVGAASGMPSGTVVPKRTMGVRTSCSGQGVHVSKRSPGS